jgi:hypothetical protein
VVAVDADRNVGRSRRIGRTRRGLDESRVGARTAESQQEFLNGAVARVGQVNRSIARKVEPKRTIEGKTRTMPRVDRQVAAESALHSADHAAGRAASVAQSGLPQVARGSGPANLGAESRKLLGVAPASLGRELGSRPGSDARSMFVRRALPTISPNLLAAYLPAAAAARVW